MCNDRRGRPLLVHSRAKAQTNVLHLSVTGPCLLHLSPTHQSSFSLFFLLLHLFSFPSALFCLLSLTPPLSLAHPPAVTHASQHDTHAPTRPATPYTQRPATNSSPTPSHKQPKTHLCTPYPRPPTPLTRAPLIIRPHRPVSRLQTRVLGVVARHELPHRSPLSLPPLVQEQLSLSSLLQSTLHSTSN